jgi:hypothetical protein
MSDRTILSGAISAPAHVDGSHLRYFLERKQQVLSKLCEELILHDRLIVPCPDFLTAVGLAAVLGERGLLELLEQRRLEFVRLEGTMVYLRGSGPDGAILTMRDLEDRKANTAPLDQAIAMGLAVSPVRLRESQKISQLLLSSTRSEDSRMLIAAAASDAYLDFRASSHWRSFYADYDPERLRLPSVGKESGRILGANAKAHDPVDILLSFASNNVELLLARKFACPSVSTSSPLGGSLNLKLKRLGFGPDAASDYWRLLELNEIPDVSSLLLSDPELVPKFVRLAGSVDALAFRKWFHESVQRAESDILAEYVRLLRQMPATSSWSGKVIRFLVSTGLGLVNPVVGTVASALDTFVLDQVLQGNSPKYFIEDFAKFWGKHGPLKL